MFSKFELIGGGVCVALMAVAIYLVQVQDTLDSSAQSAAVISSDTVVVVQQANDNQQQAQADALLEAVDAAGNLERMVIDEVKIGTGASAQSGDTVVVHYVGRLQEGTEFDNSQTRGLPIEFTIGSGEVIVGWEEGIAGMQVGGERILVIPPSKAYGDRRVGPIPPNSTFVFSVELVAIK
jgi:FKBP-type peptidyl-prolyl cis-trans isomerase